MSRPMTGLSSSAKAPLPFRPRPRVPVGPAAARRAELKAAGGGTDSHETPPNHLRRQGQDPLRRTEPGTVIQYFKDDTTAFEAPRRARIEGKGVLNNRISEYLMTQLRAIGVPTHFVRRLNMREQLIKEVEIIPLEVVVRNVAAGSHVQAAGDRGRHRRCRAPSSNITTRMTGCTIPGSAKSTSPPSAGPARRTWTTS